MSDRKDEDEFMDAVINDGGKSEEEEEEEGEDLMGSDGDDEEEEDMGEQGHDGPVDARSFFDVEAELSGDEGSSDEDEDEDDEELLVGQAEADREDVGDETEQREAIAKMFHRQQADDDKRQMLILQEKMFEDGDLHMMGKVRQRKFRWRNVGSAWIDANDNSSDEDQENQETVNLPQGGRGPAFGEVIVHFKSEFPDLYDENGEPIGKAAADGDEEDAVDTGVAAAASATTADERIKLTKTVPTFGGRADCIKSYVVFGKAQNDKFKSLTEQEKKVSPARQSLMSGLRVKKKHPIRSKRIFS